MILRFRPIKVWPAGWDPARPARPASPFSAAYSTTLLLLDRELDRLDATNATLQVDAREADCRVDGQLRATARVGFPGVILTFDTRKHGPLSYVCDVFGSYGGREGWQHNLRAIALGLEALRRVERYGIADRGQQYAGYRELGTGIALGAGMTREEAATMLVDLGEPGGTRADPADLLLDGPHYRQIIDLYFRTAAKRHHPDAGGDPETFRRLTEARDLLLAVAS